MHVTDHASNVTQTINFPAFLRVFLLVYILGNIVVPEGGIPLVYWVNAVHFWDLNVLFRQKKLPYCCVKSIYVDLTTYSQNHLAGRSVYTVTSGNLIFSFLKQIFNGSLLAYIGFSLENTENTADGHVGIYVRGTVEGVKSNHVFSVGVCGANYKIFIFLWGQETHPIGWF